VDILTTVDGLEFAACWERRVLRELGRASVPVLSIDDLIRNKKQVGRKQDLADVENLERRRAQDSGEGRVSEKGVDPRRRRRRKAAVRRR
jgi:hypothetical protein